MNEDSPFHVDDEQHYEDHKMMKSIRDGISATGAIVGHMLVWGVVVGFLAFCAWIYRATGGSIK